MEDITPDPDESAAPEPPNEPDTAQVDHSRPARGRAVNVQLRIAQLCTSLATIGTEAAKVQFMRQWKIGAKTYERYLRRALERMQSRADEAAGVGLREGIQRLDDLYGQTESNAIRLKIVGMKLKLLGLLSDKIALEFPPLVNPSLQAALISVNVNPNQGSIEDAGNQDHSAQRLGPTGDTQLAIPVASTGN